MKPVSPSSSICIVIHYTSRSVNAQELYNLQHAELHSIVKCIIGILKHCFRILTTPPQYDMNIQAYILAALAYIHNIICMYDSLELELEDIGVTPTIQSNDEC